MKWPWVARWRYDQVADALRRADASRGKWARQSAMHAGNSAGARAYLDSLLVAYGLLDSTWTDGVPERERWVVENMNWALATAVQFRETEQAGGMMGTGYINGLVADRKRLHELRERKLP